MKFISWNVNGIRAVLKKDFVEILYALDADVFCIQETKAQPEQLQDSLRREINQIMLNSANADSTVAEEIKAQMNN